MSDQHQHDWLSLVGMSGLFLSEPVLFEYFEDGPPGLERRQQGAFRREWNRWLAADPADDGTQRRWVDFVLQDVLGHGRHGGPTDLHKYPHINEKLVVELLEYEQKLWPDRVIVNEGGEPGALVYLVPRGHDLDKRETETGRWRASPFTKLDRLLRETRIPIGLLTNGDQWRVVFAEPGLPTSYLEWQAQGWYDERSTLHAFAMVLSEERFDDDPDDNLITLIHESQDRQTDVADQLGHQVRAGLRALVRALDVADRECDGAILGDMSLDKIYEMAMVVMMRLVFLLYAEENGLLPHGEVLYDEAYGLTYLWTRLQKQAYEHPESLRRAFDAWPQVLATFNVVYHGVEHPDFALPAYGGRLFAPERFPPLLSPELHIPNSAMYRVLRRLLLAQAELGGETVMQRVSYRALDVEQLGYIYEGLLGYTLRRAEETLVTFEGRGGEQRPLTELEEHATDYDALYEYLKSMSDQHWTVARRAAEESMDFTPSPDADELERLTPYGEILDLEDIVRPGDLVVVQDVGIRKRSGTYYTPTQITSFLVKQALEPLCHTEDEDGNSYVRWPEEILDLKICDPAMGSGAFLVQACRYLAERLVESWEIIEMDADEATLTMPYAKPADTSVGETLMPADRTEKLTWAKRYVAERCLYGVDLNPMAVELAKLSLWLETLSKNQPFTFLDHHLRHGNSLIGASLLAEEEVNGRELRQIAYIPDAALGPRKGMDKDERAEARSRQKDNRTAVEKIKQGQLFLAGEYDVAAALAELRQSQQALTRATHEAGDYETKERMLNQIHNEGYYPQFKALCDLWCAVWFWDPARHGPPPTTWQYVEMADTIISSAWGVAKWGSFSFAPERQAEISRISHQIANEQAFFHWELEYPDVFGRVNPGFDVMVGNPPWETVKPVSQEFFEVYDPRFRDYSKQEALLIAEELLATDREVSEAWEDYQLNRYGQNLYFGEVQYELQDGGDLNHYKLFAEKAFRSCREGGISSLVLDAGIYQEKTAKPIRQTYFFKGTVLGLFGFENRRRIFPIHSSQRFVLITVQRGGETVDFPAMFMRQDIQDLNEVARLSRSLPVELITKFNPETLSVMEFRRQHDIDVCQYIFSQFPLLGDHLPDTWSLNITNELHMTGDSHLFNSEVEGWPLYEGRMVGQFDHKAAYWISGRGRSAVWEYTGNDPSKYEPDYPFRAQWYLDSEVAKRVQTELWGQLTYRIGICSVTASTNARTVVAAILPSKSAAGHSLNIAVPEGSNTPISQELYIVSILNSFVFDYLVRFKIKLNLSQYILYQSPFPRLISGNPYFDAIVPRAARLTCTTEDFAELWQEVIGMTWPLVPAGLSEEERRVWGYGHPATEEVDRQVLRDELDALAAHLYGLTREEFDYILGTFPLVFPDTEEGWEARNRLLRVYDEFAGITEGWERE